jgi:CheY-like chemotaxis protein
METRRVLLIDDEVGFTKLVKLNLEKTGRYTVRVENSGGQALAAAREFQPELILLDIVMPGKDGGEVLAELQTNPATQRIPVAFLTATVSTKGVADRGNRIHGLPFIAKPVSPQELIGEIESILKGKNERR